MNAIEKRYYPDYLILPSLLIFLIFFIAPTILGFLMAFTDYSVFKSGYSFSGFKNFIYLFNHPQFQTAFKNTIYFAFFTTVLKTLVGLILALLLVKHIRTGTILKTLFYLPAILSPIIVAVMFQTVFRLDGLLNNLLKSMGLGVFVQDWMGQSSTVLGTVITAEIWKWSGFNMAIFIAGLQAIPMSYYEAAAIDGAPFFSQLKNITLPLVMPALTVNMTLNFIGGLKVFEQVLGLTGGGPGYASQVIGTLIYRVYGQGYYGRSAAMGMVQILTTLLLGTLMYKLLSNKEVEI